jgi:hypothetical protein
MNLVHDLKVHQATVTKGSVVNQRAQKRVGQCDRDVVAFQIDG